MGAQLQVWGPIYWEEPDSHRARPQFLSPGEACGGHMEQKSQRKCRPPLWLSVIEYRGSVRTRPRT